MIQKYSSTGKALYSISTISSLLGITPQETAFISIKYGVSPSVQSSQGDFFTRDALARMRKMVKIFRNIKQKLIAI